MGSIVVKNLGKAYKQYPSRWGRLIEWLLPDKNKPLHTLKWVLQNVSFEIAPGESVGIVGVNGAGKSTLLKMITGTTQPTTGSVEVSGRVAALLELGMGFHPDFTGRQNVIMAGQLQGMSVEEIQSFMPEIEAFSGIGDYIDQPVRVYSSGMQVRLAFAVATAKRPDVLIIDEALSVGDAAFQRKCYRRIEDFRQSGTTLLFVSHDVETVKRLCGGALYLRNGQLAIQGGAKLVCDAYEKDLFGTSFFEGSLAGGGDDRALLDASIVSENIESQYGDGGARIDDVAIRDDDFRVINLIPEGKNFCVSYRVTFSEEALGVEFGMMIKTVDGVCLYGTNTSMSKIERRYRPGDSVTAKFRLQGNLAAGDYYLNVGTTRLVNGVVITMHRRMDVLVFRVSSGQKAVLIGHVNMFGDLSVERAGAEAAAA